MFSEQIILIRENLGAGSHFIVLSHRHLWPFNYRAQLRDDVDEVTLGVVPLVAGLGLPSHVWEGSDPTNGTAHWVSIFITRCERTSSISSLPVCLHYVIVVGSYEVGF